MLTRALCFGQSNFASFLGAGHRFIQGEAKCAQRSTIRPLSFLQHRPVLERPTCNRLLPLHHHTHPRKLSTTNIQMVAKAKKQGEGSTEVKDPVAMLQKGKLIMEKLEEVYPEAPKGFLDHSDAFTLLVAVVLSAQSLDIKVNEITPELFRVGGTPEKMRDLGETKIREIIKQIGLAPQKAKNIAKLSTDIFEKFDGNVPDTFEDLESLAGVGHKTASVVMMQAFGKPAFPVDTHIHRLACRWGCGHAKSVVKTEESLKQWFPDPQTWGELHTRIILFGREYCPARNHDMDECPVCCFAATDEALKNNRLFPKKFTAPVSHKNRYSIRDITTLPPKVEEKDADYPPQPAKKQRSRSKKVVQAKAEDIDNVEVRKSGRRKTSVSYVEPGPEESSVPEAVTSATTEPKRRGRKPKAPQQPVDNMDEPTMTKLPRRPTKRTKSTPLEDPDAGSSTKKQRTSSRLKQKQGEE